MGLLTEAIALISRKNTELVTHCGWTFSLGENRFSMNLDYILQNQGEAA